MTIHITTPTSWNELTRHQLLAFTKYALKAEDALLGKMWFVVALLQVRWWQVKKQIALYLADHSQVNDILAHANFLYEDNALTKQLIPSVRVGMLWFYGPADRLKNITIAEFIFAHAYWVKHKKDQTDEEALNMMIATLYRPAKPKKQRKGPHYDGDIRQQFNQYLVEERAAKVAKLPRHVKDAILIFFDGCIQYMEQQYPKIFSNNEGNAGSYGMVEVLHTMAGDKFGDFDKVQQSRMMDILRDLTISIRQKEEKDREMMRQQRSR